MNYENIYDKLIEKALARKLEDYSELHHIIPKCIGGSNEKYNLVELTPEEHYLAHLLLVKIYPSNVKLIFAAHNMSRGRSTNKLYGWLRRKHALAMSIEMKGKKTGKSNSQYGTIWITNGKDNTKIKLSEEIPIGWHTGRTYIPVLKNIKICAECKIKAQDLYWWNVYLESKLTVTKFVTELYPYNRASFYNMKSRIDLQKNTDV
jgi:hypothetical protein